MTLLIMIKGCDCMPILLDLPFDGFGVFWLVVIWWHLSCASSIIEVFGSDWAGSIRTCSPWHVSGKKRRCRSRISSSQPPSRTRRRTRGVSNQSRWMQWRVKEIGVSQSEGFVSFPPPKKKMNGNDVVCSVRPLVGFRTPEGQHTWSKCCSASSRKAASQEIEILIEETPSPPKKKTDHQKNILRQQQLKVSSS